MKKIILTTSIILITIIVGFSQNKIERNIYAQLEETKFFDDYEAESNKKHTLYKFILNNNKKIIIAFTTSEYHSAHVNGSYMSVFTLINRNSSWIIESKFIKTTEIGSWGACPPKEDIKIYPVSNEFMITIELCYLGQGVLKSWIVCYYVVEDKIKDVGSFNIYYSNGGSIIEDKSEIEDWEAQYFFLPKNGNLPEILLNITGQKGDETFYKTEYYQYNGNKYIKK